MRQSLGSHRHFVADRSYRGGSDTSDVPCRSFATGRRFDAGSARTPQPSDQLRVYLNTAAVSLGCRRLASAYKDFIDEWTAHRLDFVRAERAADASRAGFARIIGASADHVALIPAVSAAAGLVAAQFTGASPGENLVIGAQEYSSNHFPWRQLAARDYDIRQVPFRGGGIDPDDLAARVDGGTCLIALSAVQTATVPRHGDHRQTKARDDDFSDAAIRRNLTRISHRTIAQ